MLSSTMAMSKTKPDMARREVVDVPVRDGSTIRCRVLVPHGPVKTVVTYFHGGGWVVGNIDDYETTGRRLAERLRSVVVLVGYRLAPEHRFPTAPNDCWDAFQWVTENAERLAGVQVPLVLAGDSAGGNLAAVTAQKAAREAGPSVALQLLVYPVTDTDINRPSYLAFENQLSLSRPTMEWFFDQYAPDEGDREDPALCPLRSDVPDGLAPAVVITARHDVLHDEGVAYADKLEAAGISVVHRHFDRQMHGFFTMFDVLPAADEALEFLGQQVERQLAKSSRVDALVVGAGFSGLFQLHRLREMGLSARVVDKAAGVGGTWYWNRYPGARCDIESMAYSYSFSKELEQEWTWSERYAAQPEILCYIEHVVERFDLARDITLSTGVEQAVFDEDEGRWYVHTDTGEVISARFLIMATGCLSVPKDIDIPGKDQFAGPSYVTGRWPHEGVDFTGQNVAVIGTGSSGVQSIPLIAEQAKSLTVYQRTPTYTLPANNRPLAADEVASAKTGYPRYRSTQKMTPTAVVNPPPPTQSWYEVPSEEREQRYAEAWDSGLLSGMAFLFTDIPLDQGVNDDVARFQHGKIREIVRDPNVAEALIPRSYPFATKRPCLDTNYYETFNRDNVELVSLAKTPIVGITEQGIKTTAGEKAFDAIVFATGFDAMTGALTAIDIRGRNGVSLKDRWSDGPSSYLGLGVSEFPNFFTITGPSSPSVLTNMLVSIEQHVDWISDCLAWMQQHNHTVVEPTQAAEEEWAQHTQMIAELTLFPKSNSWYIGANVPGKAKVMMTYVGGAGAYRQVCNSVAASGYEGFRFSSAAAAGD